MPVCALGEFYTVEGTFESAARRSKRGSRDESTKGGGRTGKVLLMKKAVERLGDLEEAEEAGGVEETEEADSTEELEVVEVNDLVEEVEDDKLVKDLEVEVEEPLEAPWLVGHQDKSDIEAEGKGVGEVVVDVEPMDEDNLVIDLEIKDDDDGTITAAATNSNKEKKAVVIGVGREEDTEEVDSEITPNKDPPSAVPVFTPMGLNLSQKTTRKDEDENSEARDLFNYYSDEGEEKNSSKEKTEGERNIEKQTEQERDDKIQTQEESETQAQGESDMQMERELFGYEDGDAGPEASEDKRVQRDDGLPSQGTLEKEEEDNRPVAEGGSNTDTNERDTEISGHVGPLARDENMDESISPLELGLSIEPFPGIDSLVPEADMEISPTFPRWEDPHVENLLTTALEVSGLAFAIDVCGKHQGKADDVLCLML